MKVLIQNRVPALLALLCVLGLVVLSYGISTHTNNLEDLQSRRIILYYTDTGEAIYGEEPAAGSI
ncbi:hypothetical protein [Deinococcus cellulosilyticus]|uniref:Uncharacterized protein n=1 Tax=Deinococcus cellulosilyticus (strain DSM 18568 / NBRC 106333 / KACC 11606 / 5516J-15) TaxID=1223518 RepID=A0A511MY85_DEIC1|nr:hypothetical protein [Deinococcus cellulosilyticus]GEM45550.1 hypothetical protein DC3_11850 [Deinococcus cellulosilyticus NBRC 106333 = KACC 11606]